TYHSKDSGPSQGLYLCRVVLRHRCIRTELITLNLICPSTYQLLQSSIGDSGPDMSFDRSASPECGTDIQEKNKKKAKNKLIRARSGKDQVKSKSKVIHMKKIQLEGLKLSNLKLYCKRKRQGSKLQRRQRLHSSYTT
ncbi:hypothetical protein Tco_0867439, partial [Tanacetum coccineum]